MFQTFKNAFKIPDLRNKILFTLFIILLYRIGVAVPVPYIQTGIENVFDPGSAMNERLKATLVQMLSEVETK